MSNLFILNFFSGSKKETFREGLEDKVEISAGIEQQMKIKKKITKRSAQKAQNPNNSGHSSAEFSAAIRITRVPFPPLSNNIFSHFFSEPSTAKLLLSIFLPTVYSRQPMLNFLS